MGRNRQDDAESGRPRLQEQAEADAESRPDERDDFVFDFTGLHQPDFTDLSLILTARLQTAAEDRVWVRALPGRTWQILYSLGLHRLFRPYPGESGEMN